METKRAVITAAGESQRTLPLQTLVDRDGQTKTALRIVIEEALAARIEEICVIIAPGDEAAYALAAGPHAKRLRFVVQEKPAGYGHAVHCARDFTRGEPFLLMVGDHLYVSGSEKRCAQQLVEVAKAERCSVSAVQPTHESKLPFYGTVGGQRVANRQGAVRGRPGDREADAHRGRAEAASFRGCAPGTTCASSGCTCSRRR